MSAEAATHHGPLDQFAVSPFYQLPELFGVDASLTNSSLFMLIAVAAVALFYVFAFAKQEIVPGRLQSLGEVIYQFVRGIVDENAGHEGQKYFTFIFTLFLFILFANFVGLIPTSFATTSHIIITFGMGAFTFLGITLIAIAKQGPIGFFKHFVPSGLPIFIIPLMLVIELVSYLSRPLSLGIRLAANITAGHTLMHVMAGFVFPLGLFGVAPVLFLIFMNGLEFFVAVLQAYVFTLLSCMYLGEALADHH